MRAYPGNSFSKKGFKPLFGAAIFLTAALLLPAGCGGSESGSATSGTAPAVGSISRPSPGTVEQIDSLNDISAADQNLETAPSFLDINSASVSKQGNDLVFTMVSASALPEGPQAGTAVEWGFLTDNNKDGSPDWGVFADLTTKDGWVAGIYNQKTKERLAGPAFPGTFTHAGTTITITVPAASLGSPDSFRWFAYTDAAIAQAGGKTQKAGDRIWEPAVPTDSKDWLPFP